MLLHRMSRRNCGGALSGKSHGLRKINNLIATFDLFYRILVLMEWMVGYGFGRPCSIHDEE